MNSSDLFSDIVVVELASVLAGPMAAMFFAEMGATVYKIEHRSAGGDVTRQWRLSTENQDQQSAYYSSINYGKAVVMLDLDCQEDYEHLLSLIRKADIVISNYNDRISSKLRVDYPTLRNIVPDIIYAQLYAYDASDTRPGFDLVMQAESGLMMMNGHPDRPPAKLPVALVDVLAAHQIKEAILVALYKRAIDGKGAYTAISLYQSAIAALVNQASNYLMADHIPKRMGTLHPNIAPYGDTFYTSDGELLILAVGSQLQWQKLVETLNLPEGFKSTFGDNASRVKLRATMSSALQNQIEKVTYADLSRQLLSNAIPFCKVLSLEEVFRLPLASDMILQSKHHDQAIRCVSTVAFDIKRF